MPQFLSSLTMFGWIQVIGGGALCVLGLCMLWLGRVQGKRAAGDNAARPALGATLPGVGRVSEATRLLISTGMLLIGYHVVVWAFPAALTPLQAPREYWWVCVGVIVLVVASSIGMDRKEPPPG